MYIYVNLIVLIFITSQLEFCVAYSDVVRLTVTFVLRRWSCSASVHVSKCPQARLLLSNVQMLLHVHARENLTSLWIKEPNALQMHSFHFLNTSVPVVDSLSRRHYKQLSFDQTGNHKWHLLHFWKMFINTRTLSRRPALHLSTFLLTVWQYHTCVLCDADIVLQLPRYEWKYLTSLVHQFVHITQRSVLMCLLSLEPLRLKVTQI